MEKQNAYKNDFEKFLAHTNEKEILRDEIIQEIKKRKAKSLLDIGAGNGLLSIPIAQVVDRYLAIEPKEVFVKTLKAAGLDVIHDRFPTILEDQFDFVLSSHSIKYDKALFEPFVRAAWKCVAPNGALVIITYRGQEDDWTRLMDALGENPTDRNRVGYNGLIMLLNDLGEVKTKKIKTTVRTDTIDDMIDALALVAANGVPERKEEFMKKRTKLEKILRSSYTKNSGFEFPFQHYIISTLK